MKLNTPRPERPRPKRPARLKPQKLKPARVEELQVVARAQRGLPPDTPAARAMETFVSTVAAAQNDTRPRLRMYNLVTRHLIQLPSGPLKFLRDYKPTKVLSSSEKQSVSDSVISFGTLQPTAADRAQVPDLEVLRRKTVCVKYAVARRSTAFKLNEPQIAKVVSSLVADNYTPHIMLYIYHFDIQNAHEALRGDTTGINPALLRAIRAVNKKVDMPSATIMVSEAGDGLQLNKLPSPASHRDIYVILFQVLYTVWQLEHARSTHYDLHAGNVFLQKVDPADPADNVNVYIVSGTRYILTRNTAYFPRLFDWDHSYTEGITKGNDSRDWYCKRAGICNELNSAYDTDRLIMYLLNKSMVPADVAGFLREYYRRLRQKMTRDQSRDPNLQGVTSTDRFYLCQPKPQKPRKCVGSLLKYIDREYNVHAPAFLPWPRDLVREYVAAFSGSKGFVARDGFDEFDAGFMPGTSRFVANVYFAHGVDRKAVTRALQKADTSRLKFSALV